MPINVPVPISTSLCKGLTHTHIPAQCSRYTSTCLGKGLTHTQVLNIPQHVLVKGPQHVGVKGSLSHLPARSALADMGTLPRVWVKGSLSHAHCIRVYVYVTPPHDLFGKRLTSNLSTV